MTSDIRPLHKEYVRTKIDEISKKFGGQKKSVPRKSVRLSPKSNSDKKRVKAIKNKIDDVNERNKNVKIKVDTPKTGIKSNKVARIIEAFDKNVDVKGKSLLIHDAKSYEDTSDGDNESKIKDAFKIMLESQKGVNTKCNTPRRQHRSKRLLSAGGQKSVKDWLEMKN